MDFPTLIGAIKQANPGIKPGALYNAINLAIPMLNAQGLQQWRQLQGGVNVENAQTRATGVAQTGQHYANEDANAANRTAIMAKKNEDINTRFNETLQANADKLEKARNAKDLEAANKDLSQAYAQKISAMKSELTNASMAGDADGVKYWTEQIKGAIAEQQQRQDAAALRVRGLTDQNSSTAKPLTAQPGQPKNASEAGPQAVGDPGTSEDNPIDVPLDQADQQKTTTFFKVPGDPTVYHGTK